jgi:hypothetical protein
MTAVVSHFQLVSPCMPWIPVALRALGRVGGFSSAVHNRTILGADSRSLQAALQNTLSLVPHLEISTGSRFKASSLSRHGLSNATLASQDTAPFKGVVTLLIRSRHEYFRAPGMLCCMQSSPLPSHHLGRNEDDAEVLSFNPWRSNKFMRK